MPSRSVIWITLESTRYDHTSLSNHSRDTTPNLQRLASTPQSNSFEFTHSHGIWTPTSSASILTCKAPTEHRVGIDRFELANDIPTIPESFAASGYRTVCCSPNAQLSSATGLDRGFDAHHYISKKTLLQEVPVSILARYLTKIHSHGGGLTSETRLHNTGYFLNELAKDHISRTDNDPLFLYVHHGDSHQPYTPPPAWRDTFEDDLPDGIEIEDAMELALDMNSNLLERNSSERGFDAVELEALRVIYDTQLRYVDSLVGELIEASKSHLEDPIIVVTADHGELLGERGLLAHRFACDTTLTHVPAVVYGIDAELSTSGPVQHADIMTTLCDALHVDFENDIGVNLETSHREYAYTQRGADRFDTAVEEVQDMGLTLSSDDLPSGTVTNAIDSEFRYEHSSIDPARLLKLDDETEDVSDRIPNVLTEMRSKTNAWLARHTTPSKSPRSDPDIEENMKEQLRELGYLVD